MQWLQICKTLNETIEFKKNSQSSKERKCQCPICVNVNIQYMQMSDMRMRVKCMTQSGIKRNFTVDRQTRVCVCVQMSE